MQEELKDIKFEDFEAPMIEYIRKGKKNRTKRGMLFAGIHPNEPDKVQIGFSLVHSSKDRFDWIYDEKTGRYYRQEGFGKDLVAKRAVKWSDYQIAVLDSNGNGDIPPMVRAGETEGCALLVPQSMSRDLKKFIRRCRRYYRGKELPVWTQFLSPNNVSLPLIEI
jgi:hypothetical protein